MKSQPYQGKVEEAGARLVGKAELMAESDAIAREPSFLGAYLKP
jgi:hypothetical protein